MSFKPTRTDRATGKKIRTLGIVNEHGLHVEAFGDLLIVSLSSHEQNLRTGFASALGLKIVAGSTGRGAELLLPHIMLDDGGVDRTALTDIASTKQAQLSIRSLCLSLGARIIDVVEGDDILHCLIDRMLTLNNAEEKTTRHTLRSQGSTLLETFQVDVTSCKQSLEIGIDGYGGLSNEAPIKLTHIDGELRLLVSLDPRKPSSSKTILIHPNCQRAS